MDPTMSMPTMAGSTMDMDGTTMNMDGGGGHMHMMMKMYFHASETEMILFKFWVSRTAGSMVYSCAIIFVLALLYEGIKYFRDYLYKRSSSKQVRANGSDASTVELNKRDSHQQQSWASSVFNSSHFIQTILHALQFLVSYLLMLVFMTYNIYLCLAVILGAAFGFFVFGWRRDSSIEITEHCH